MGWSAGVVTGQALVVGVVIPLITPAIEGALSALYLATLDAPYEHADWLLCEHYQTRNIR
jgi:hypothetical protein